MKDLVLISGSSHQALSKGIANYLGIDLLPVKLGKFSNKETSVEIIQSVRNKHVYVLQSACGNINDNLIELMILIQACLMGSARKISVVTPLFPYSRQSEHSQSKRLETCSPLAVKGADHLIAMDLHDAQYQGFFKIPVDLVFAEPCIISYIKHNIPDWKNSIIVSPDAGGAKRAASICNKLGLNFALIHKESSSNRDGENNESMGLIGAVSGRVAIIMDDILDTGKTLKVASDMLRLHGASKIHAIVIHGLFTMDAINLINNSYIDDIAVTNSVPQDQNSELCPKLHVIDVSHILGETIRRSFNGESVSHLFLH
ncbi:Ribose-phosphate pyrophosphokinase 2 [Smittium mucronatum]|uniref:ribose-phosphate diphosphokinase n=1 Tax=Smittium mucronatum TaxID=133383 RepID=A0A1R0GLJ9_9FUNG|nr:Ribose-phosphate pyrophosphokinase 2 [Smittium mucronatum]OLY77762.1 Ribose-phosphate pyrophosphokinase 2 [Smittium mucronatum]